MSISKITGGLLITPVVTHQKIEMEFTHPLTQSSHRFLLYCTQLKYKLPLTTGNRSLRCDIVESLVQQDSTRL